LIVILAGVIVLAGTATLNAPNALDRHMQRMQSAMNMVNDDAMMEDLRENFVAAVNDILLLAAIAATLVAVIISIIVSRRIVDPIQSMTDASTGIAAGDYHRRVAIRSEDELGTLARSFNVMAENLEQTEQRRVALIGDVAHELRTPLAVVRSSVEAIADDAVPPDSEQLAEIQREVARLQRLITDLEDLSRAEAGQIHLTKQPTDVAVLIRAATTRLQSQFEDKGVALVVVMPDMLPTIPLDADRIQQVLINLLGNALHYTPSDGRVCINVRLITTPATPGRNSDGGVEISVQDTGIGIAQEHISHLFERFYRVDKSRSRLGGGSGIGLTIARHVVEAHGGRIWVESQGVGKGSTFTFTLPLM
jgi:histidine kinase